MTLLGEKMGLYICKVFFRHSSVMETEEQFVRLMERHNGTVRRLCVLYSDGDEQLCRDLMQEAVACMWTNYRRREGLLWEAAQGAWVYWQTMHGINHTLRGRRHHGGVALAETVESMEAVEQPSDGSLVDELADGLSGRERQLLELLRQGYSNEEIASRMDVSPSTLKRIRRTMLEHMRRRAEALGMKTKEQ